MTSILLYMFRWIVEDILELLLVTAKIFNFFNFLFYLIFFLGDNYKIPLTLSYIGIGELPFGVKVTVFDHINCIETGIFYTINEKLWRKKNKENDKAKKKKKYILDNELDEKYNINTVLKTIGYVLLMDSVRIRENNLKVTLEGRVTFNRSGKISQLESALSINNIINSYQKNNFSK